MFFKKHKRRTYGEEAKSGKKDTQSQRNITCTTPLPRVLILLSLFSLNSLLKFHTIKMRPKKKYHPVILLLKKEITMELKQPHSLNGIILYVVSTVFVTYLSFHGDLPITTWNSIFWIILMFGSMNAASRVLYQEPYSRHGFYYQLINPTHLILSRLLYNGVLMGILALLTFGGFALLVGNPVKHTGFFLFELFVGGLGLSSVLTVVAAIASRAGQSFSLMAILSFPLVLPLMLVLINLGEQAINADEILNTIKGGAVLLLLAFLPAAIGVLLFPHLWRD